MQQHESAKFDKGIYDCEVLALTNLRGKIYLMRVNCPAIARHAQAGQFVNIKVTRGLTPFLRKPFSICRRNQDEGWIEILWKIVGEGTSALAGYVIGDSVDVIGPLGRGYSWVDDISLALLVGGGIGVAPLPFLCEELRERGIAVEAFIGARNVEDLAMIEVFRELGAELFLSTEDGSAGQQGLVTAALITRLHGLGKEASVSVFGCGPNALLRRIGEIASQFSIESQVAIETMMGCGFGICVGCPVRTRRGREGGGLYKLACVDGPVFNSQEVCLDD